MRVGIIVDGKSEVAALPEIRPALEAATGNTILRPIFARIDPTADVGTMTRVLAARLQGLEKRGLAVAVVLLDREQQPVCPSDLATRVRRSLERRGNWTCTIQVVVKDRMFENWLIADPGALKRQRGRVFMNAATEHKVVPNKADHVEALELLQAAVVSHPSYRKVSDSQRILANADIAEMAANSRSFRRFLRCLGHPDYQDQSHHPRSPRA